MEPRLRCHTPDPSNNAVDELSSMHHHYHPRTHRTPYRLPACCLAVAERCSEAFRYTRSYTVKQTPNSFVSAYLHARVVMPR